jgi:AcrR family transcriptional regulator
MSAEAPKSAVAKRTPRKSAEAREKDLRLAMYRIERGRARTGESKMSISAVAREAGVTTALIHNHYPTVAEDIRKVQGKDSRAQRDVMHESLKSERQRSRELRQEIESLRADVARLASINEVLIAESAALRAQSNDPKVVKLKKPS